MSHSKLAAGGRQAGERARLPDVYRALAAGAHPSSMSPAAFTGPQARAVMAAVASLPAPERAVVEAVDVRGVPHAEAADALGVPLGIVMRRLYRGRQQVVRSLGS